MTDAEMTAWDAMLQVLREAEKLYRPTDAMAKKIGAANAALDAWEAEFYSHEANTTARAA